MLKLNKKMGYYTTVCGTYEVYYSRFSITHDLCWTASPRKKFTTYKIHYSNTLEEMEALLKETYPELATPLWAILHGNSPEE